MAKEFPFFIFTPGEYLKGDITLCSEEAQGIFIQACCYYWLKECKMSLIDLKQRFIKNLDEIEELLDSGVILRKKRMIHIIFLDEQMEKIKKGQSILPIVLTRSKAPGQRRMIKPTIEEVREYCEIRDNNVDPAKWYAHYESKGWKVGKTPMEDWKAAVRYWESPANPYNKSTTRFKQKGKTYRKADKII